MKRGFLVGVMLIGLVLILSVSFVSAGFGSWIKGIFGGEKDLSLNPAIASSSSSGPCIDLDLDGIVDIDATCGICEDEEIPKDYYSFGRIRYTDINGATIYKDSCSGTTLTEYFCDAPGGNFYSETFNCANGCLEGACESRIVSNTPSPSVTSCHNQEAIDRMVLTIASLEASCPVASADPHVITLCDHELEILELKNILNLMQINCNQVSSCVATSGASEGFTISSPVTNIYVYGDTSTATSIPPSQPVTRSAPVSGGGASSGQGNINQEVTTGSVSFTQTESNIPTSQNPELPEEEGKSNKFLLVFAIIFAILATSLLILLVRNIRLRKKQREFMKNKRESSKKNFKGVSDKVSDF